MSRRYFIIGTTLLITLVFSACNFLVSPMHGRENPNDWKAQIYDVFAAQLSSNTVEVSFPWRDRLNNSDDDEAIEEAMLVYSVGKSLPVRTAPLPPDSGGSYGFSFEDGKYLYTKEIDGLAEGDEVWFALYPRIGIRWLAPLYEKIEIKDPANIPVTVGAGPFFPEAGATMAFDGWLNELQTGDPYTIDGTVGAEQYLLLRFELPDRVRCTDAVIDMPVSGVAEIGFAYPIITRYYEHTDESTRLRLIDYNNGSSFTYDQASTGTAIVTEAVNAAIRYGSDTILLSIDSGVTENSVAPDFGAETLTITYEQY